MKSNKFKCFDTENDLIKGMSLIEVMIFTAIISIVLVSMVGITASMTRQMRINYNKIYATHYAEELADWLRVQKDVVGWTQFFSHASGLTGSQTNPNISRTFCVNVPIELNSTYTSLITTPLFACPPSSFGITDSSTSPKIYKRSVEFSQTCSVATACSNTRGISAKIKVEWEEAGGADYQVEINTVYAPL